MNAFANVGETGGHPLDTFEYIPRDKSWLQLLPEGSSVISARGHGASYWAQSGRIDVRLAAGGEESLFIKMTRGDIGRIMVKGEFESMKMLHTMSPGMIPKPIGFGTYESDADAENHFFLCEFVDLLDELPNVVDFSKDLAELHIKSVDYSPTGKFGFVQTCPGTIQQYLEWTSSWEAFFIQSQKRAFQLEEESHGPSPGIIEMLPALYEKVWPRLLRPLETKGRVLRPCLVHGDLWDGNTGVHTKTGQHYVFDAAALWAHNEYEHHAWRGLRFRIGESFLKEYFNSFPISPPEEDWNDRNLLYSLQADLHDSTLYKNTDRFRGLIIKSMRELVDKFSNGHEGPAMQKDSTGLSGMSNQQTQTPAGKLTVTHYRPSTMTSRLIPVVQQPQEQLVV